MDVRRKNITSNNTIQMDILRLSLKRNCLSKKSWFESIFFQYIIWTMCWTVIHEKAWEIQDQCTTQSITTDKAEVYCSPPGPSLWKHKSYLSCKSLRKLPKKVIIYPPHLLRVHSPPGMQQLVKWSLTAVEPHVLMKKVVHCMTVDYFTHTLNDKLCVLVYGMLYSVLHIYLYLTTEHFINNQSWWPCLLMHKIQHYLYISVYDCVFGEWDVELHLCN